MLNPLGLKSEASGERRNNTLNKVRAAQVHVPIARIPNPFDAAQNPNYGPRPSFENVSFQTPAIDGKKQIQTQKLPFRTALQIAQETPEVIEWPCNPYVVIGGITEVDGKVKLAGKSLDRLCLWQRAGGCGIYPHGTVRQARACG